MPDRDPQANNMAIDLAAEMAATGLGEILAEMEQELVGRGPLTTRIREAIFLLLINKVRKHLHLSGGPSLPQMAFLGSPGTGKSIVAVSIAKILYRLSYTKSPTLHQVRALDLLARRPEDSVQKTQQALQDAQSDTLYLSGFDKLMGGEAEVRGGSAVIRCLAERLAGGQMASVLILTGECRPMIRLFQERLSLAENISYRLEFPDYSYTELMVIAERVLQGWNYQFSAAGKSAFAEYLPLRMELDHFANAQSVKNALKRSCLRQAKRLCEASSQAVSQEALMTLEAEDIFAVPQRNG